MDEYSQRLATRQAVAAERQRTHLRLGKAKVTVLLAGVGYVVATISNPSLAICALAGAAFLALAVWHEITIKALTRAQAAVRFYSEGLARLEDRWVGTGETGERFRDSRHPYADDLDVFGPGGLFQLVSGARTPMGEERLAAWLSSAAEPSVLRERHSRISGLRRRIDLRERIAIAKAVTHRRTEPARLLAWAEAAPALPKFLRPLAVLLALAFAGAVVNACLGGSASPLVPLALINFLLLRWLAKPANAVVEGLSAATESAGLDLLSNVVSAIEQEAFDDPSLAALAARLSGSREAASASHGFARLASVSSWADAHHGLFARLLEIPLLFTLQVACAAESWKARHGAQLRGWVDAVAEMEALLSLAGYSYEHPGDPFPELLEPEDGDAIFDGVALAHPLIPAAAAIPNSVSLDARTRVLMVSGSNMSGKSTLLRTVGLNAVLALAGAPVRASRLRLTPLAVGTCLRHTDSLHEGRSGFYTEVLRLRLVYDLLDGPRRVLFLFDELLSGTNSKDRRLAAEGLVRMMLARRAIGLVTTHDLALAEIATLFSGPVRNVHLQDHVEDGQMRFDYKLREGVIQHSNALELMRLIGLDVEGPGARGPR